VPAGQPTDPISLRTTYPLESTDLPVDDVAERVGFTGGTSLREHLHAAIGVAPRTYRRTFRGSPSSSR
jgi:transcriptional regulator GlxA family with amidase domain